MTDSEQLPGPERSEQPVNVTALVAEAMSKSGLLWIEVPRDRAWPAWHAWVPDTAYVVNGPGEQHLPWLPEEVTLVLRSKDTGGRLLTVRARTRVLTEDDPQWTTAAEALKASRLNATDDVLQRWRSQCTVTALTPIEGPVEVDGGDDKPSGAAPVPPSRATTATWRPWHWRGRPTRRRGNR